MPDQVKSFEPINIPQNDAEMLLSRRFNIEEIAKVTSPHSDFCCLNFGCENPKVCDELGPCGNPNVGGVSVSAEVIQLGTRGPMRWDGVIPNLIVEDSHFAYLRQQKGSLDTVAHDREAWHLAYEQALTKDFAGIRPFLPVSCSSILDVGGGLGGIDALLVKKFGTDCEVCILDGENDPPVMHLHRETFNNMDVARDFLGKNGVQKFSYYAPPKLGTPRPFDLILSLGSWCFHYEPKTYLGFVRACCRPGTVIILDVRKQKDEWIRQLKSTWRWSGVIHVAHKRDRMVFVA